jgi:hypothetical protein
MTRALVVYESMFGNTEEIARAVADGLAQHLQVQTVPVTDAPVQVPDDVALLVVGGPTHAFGMSRHGTREDASRRGAQGAAQTGVREWLDRVSMAAGTRVAAFDTRIDKVGVPGSAARAIARRLRRRGGKPLAPPQTFRVRDIPGPLVPTARGRARIWGTELADLVVDHTPAHN